MLTETSSPVDTTRAEAIRAIDATLELRRRERLRKVKPFRGANLDAQTITRGVAAEWIVSGPAETAKTFSLLWRLYSLCKETPNAQAVIVRKVHADMHGTVLRTWERICEIRGKLQKFGGENPQFYEFENKARLYIAGMDRPGAVLSGERDFIYVNQAEELPLGAWEYLVSRSTGRGSVSTTPMLFGDCNPDAPSHWILQRPTLKVLHTTHRDNPSLYGEDGTETEQGARTIAALDSLTGVRRERLFLGKWVAAEGTVYEFDRSAHVVEAKSCPEFVRRIRAIDFGHTNPFVCQWWGIDNDDRMYLYREIYRTKTIVEDHAKEIQRLSGDERYEVTVADHDAEDRATLARHGIDTEAAFKEVTPGLNACMARLRKASDGKPRLFVVEGALTSRDDELAAAHKPTCTADEFEVYSWAKGADGKPVKEEPVKVNDHGMDAMRYAVAYLDEVDDAAGAGWAAAGRAAKARRVAA